MNPLCLKKKYRYFLVLLVFCSSSAVWAQETAEESEFQRQCETADAYLLHSYTDVTYTPGWSNYSRYVSINNKLVVQTSTGVDQYAYLSLSADQANQLKEVEVTTYKADGRVLELDSAKAFERKNTRNRFDDINYPIPGVEPGDTIESKYTYVEYPDSDDLYDFVYLQANVPILKSEYTIKTGTKNSIRFKGYNEMTEPQVVTNDTLIYMAFAMDKVGAISENQNTCIPCQLPYAYYSVEDKDKEPPSWKKIYNKGFNIVTQPFSFDRENFNYYNRWKRNALGDAKNLDRFKQFEILHEEILNTMTMESAQRDEILKSSGYFLKEGRLNPISVRRLYRRMLEELEIEYWAVFARSKRSGAIDPYFIRSGEFDHIFFAYKDYDGNFNLVYPHDEVAMYRINEIPTELYNTEAVIAKPYGNTERSRKDKFIGFDMEMAEVDSVEVKVIRLPDAQASQNFAKQTYYVDLGEEKESFPTQYRMSVSGGIYTDVKGFLGLMEQDEEVSEYYNALEEFEGEEEIFELDSITSTRLKDTQPFAYTMSGTGRIVGGVSYLNDNMVSISLENLLDHNELESDESEGAMNFYLDYQYTDDILLILKFPKAIEVLNQETYNVNFANELGTYVFDLKLINGNELTLKSRYRISQDVIRNNEQPKLSALNAAMKNIRNNRILVRLKGD